MDPKSIATLKFKAYLKAPRVGNARVELCTNSHGRLVAVKWTTAPKSLSSDVPGSLVYDCFRQREQSNFLQHLPTLLCGDVWQTQDSNLGRMVTEYCQGHDLEELVKYAGLSGEALPEPFLWHIIHNFIEYCFALSTCHLEMTTFDPANVLFAFDYPSFAEAGENAELQYPRVVFCGLSCVEDQIPDDPELQATHSKVCRDAIREFGEYLLDYIESLPPCEEQTVTYSEALVSWLKIIAHADAAPPRVLDMYHILTMLGSRTSEFRGPMEKLKLSPWLSCYFKQLQLDSDLHYSVVNGLNRGSTETEVKEWLDELHTSSAYRFGKAPPSISADEDASSLVTKLKTYFDAAEYPFFETDNLIWTGLIRYLSNVLHQSLDRSILLGRWSGTWYKDTNNMSFKYVEKTRFAFDEIEPYIFRGLFRILIRCQVIGLDLSRKVFEDACVEKLDELDKDSKDTLGRLAVLLSEVEIQHQIAFQKAAWDASRWKIYHREVRSTVKVRSSISDWERLFDVAECAFRLARNFVLKPSTYRGKSIEEYLRRELNISPNKPLHELIQDKNVARGGVANEWYESVRSGQHYNVPNWKETSEERKQRHAEHAAFDQEAVSKYMKTIRENGERTAEALRSPGNTDSTASQSPKGTITGNLELARDEETEFRKMPRPPPLAPRKRKDITQAEARMLKIYKRWGQNFGSRSNLWYTDAGLWENFRQQLIRGSRDFKEIKASWNRRGAHGGQFNELGNDKKTPDDVMDHITWYLGHHKPKRDLEQMSICSAEIASDYPVEEKPELWNLDDSSGTEDEVGRYVSKRVKL